MTGSNGSGDAAIPTVEEFATLFHATAPVVRDLLATIDERLVREPGSIEAL